MTELLYLYLYISGYQGGSMKDSLLRIMGWVIGGCRIVVGLLVIKAGYQLSQRQGAFSFWDLESSLGGLFVMLLGVAFLALALFPKSFEGSG